MNHGDRGQGSWSGVMRNNDRLCHGSIFIAVEIWIVVCLY